MPDQKIRQIMTAMDPADVSQMAMIECVRQLADNGKVTNKLLEGMGVELKDVRERVIRIEAAEYKAEIQEAKQAAETARVVALGEVAAIDKRVVALEADKNRRDGALSLVEWFGRNWPALIGFVALVVVVVLANNGRFHL